MYKRLPVSCLCFCLSMLFIFNSCAEENYLSEQESISSGGISSIKSACGTTELVWLQEIIEKAEEDKRSMAHQGNFLGTIYLETYQNEPLILVRMMMGSGGLYGYFYRCDGSQIDFSDANPRQLELFFQSLEKGTVIYTNVPHN